MTTLSPLGVRLAFRRALWRVSRKYYCLCRFDGPNDPAVNGEYALVQRLLSAGIGGTFVDIGSNRGLWAKAVLDTAGRRGLQLDKLVLFEPNPHLASFLEGEFGRFGSLVEVRCIALADEDAVRPFFVERTTGGTSSLWDPPPFNSAEYSATVRRFDSSFDANVHFGMVKIDCEGGDLLVLRGMKRALARQAVDLVQFEYNIKWRATRTFLRDAWDLALEVGYVFGKVSPGGGVVLRSWNDELERFFEANYFLATRSTVETLGLRQFDWMPSNTLCMSK